ncbi:MAG TPA: MBL fold metallo-hydrolase [Blastocatellia bacterium]|jgi:glyoxylase-like metal-dependent hydrolase (beta-lactamase superfamily II)
MQVQQLEADIYALIGETYKSNSVAVIDRDDALLVDAMADQRDAESLRSFIEDDLKKRVRLIICTHYFSDHLAALRLFPQSLIVAHKNYRHTFDSELFRSEEERGHFVEPDILISDEMTIRWGRYNLDIFHNPGHTMSTLNIDIPEADLLLTGDTVVGNIVYIAYSTPQMFFTALERARRRTRCHIIGSHLGRREGSAIDHALHYLASLQSRVRSARETSDSKEAILNIELKDCLASGLEASSFESIFHKRNLDSIVERNLFA